MSTKVTDLTFLRENTFGNQSSMKDLIQVYIDTTPEMIQQMKAYCQIGSFDKLQGIAHKLKSNINAMGMQTAFRILDQIEHGVGPKTDRAVVAQWLDELEEMYVISENELQQELLDFD